MFLRDTDFRTLKDLGEELTSLPTKTWGGSSAQVKVALTEGEDEQTLGTVAFGKHEIPATANTLSMLAGYYDIPSKFLLRLPADEKQFVLDHRIERSADVATTIVYDKTTGIREMQETSKTRVSLEQLFGAISSVMPSEAMVLDYRNTPAEFLLDVVVPEGFDKGIGGDKKVGDWTNGGVRCGQDRKANLAPWVQPLGFRLACTNGMEFPHHGIRVDARGSDAASITAMFQAEVQRAFDTVEKDIEEFYSLREVKVSEDRTGEFRVLAQEQGLPDRIIGRMENTLADALMAEEQVTMFHLVNHLTNQANNPEMASRSLRRNLQIAGGAITHDNAVDDHAARCDMCHTKIRQN